jgi:hypothetical protein
MIQAICAYFNPLNYKVRYRNYCEFRDKLTVPVKMIECTFEGQKPVIDDAIHVTATRKNILWQKERLLNILLETLDCDKVVWLDADVIFDNSDWVAATVAKLDECELVQPYQFVEHWSADKSEVVERRPGAGHIFSTEGIRSGTPGFAWAARRELLEGGFYDRSIIGNGDRLMFNRWVDEPPNDLPRREVLGVCEWGWEFLPPVWMQDVGNWSRQAEGIGCVPGVIRHLWHGYREHRRYAQRAWQLDRLYSFDPSRDLELDSNGLWRTDREDVLWYVKAYLEGRREDGDVLML